MGYRVPLTFGKRRTLAAIRMRRYVRRLQGALTKSIAWSRSLQTSAAPKRSMIRAHALIEGKFYVFDTLNALPPGGWVT
jgi:hypothetical protein